MASCSPCSTSSLQEFQDRKSPASQLSVPQIFRYESQTISPSCAPANSAKSEAAIIQKIYTHFKKTPPDHKLGVLYVVDSVTRQWVDQAKKSGQVVGGGAPDGTFAAGVTRVTELLPSFMNDITSTAPEDHKVRIRKLFHVPCRLDWHISQHQGWFRPFRLLQGMATNCHCVAKDQEALGNLGAIKHLLSCYA